MDFNDSFHDHEEPANPTEGSDALIGFNVAIPEEEPFQMFYPAGNWYGAFLLIRSLEMALRQNSIPFSSFSCCGALNYCTGVMEIPLALRAEALRVFREFFEEIRLLPNVSICFFDPAEGVWRAVHKTALGVPAEVHFEEQTLARLRAISLDRSVRFENALNARFPEIGS